MSSKNIRLSILDQSPVRKGVTASQAIKETIELAKLADNLGYTRFWVSEHHNTTTLAGSTPEVLIAHLAGETQNIRLGSGGVMLPNHSALKVAENFRMLEVLFPGRIDLGLGRAPGTDRITASILNPSNQWKEQDFLEQLVDLRNYLHDTAEPGTIQEKITAIPKALTVPPLWLLSSSGQSGIFAAHFGMNMSFAHFINPHGGPEAVQLYRERFQPSIDNIAPEANVSVFVFCSEDEELISRQQALMDYRFLQLEKGGRLFSVSYEDIKNVSYNSAEQERINHNRQRVLSGTPDVLKEKIDTLLTNYQVDELMAVTITEGFEERIRSYELLAAMYLK
ncbi:LLM class flavin-dependent oxidoreductase [Pedobacter cryoconitis]|uniref:Luciferase-like monooxygenase n=1 Tax=Pedobacter cryoconitis TaxID=188932 RepID=A0A7X0J4I9_9SPHI|nr:LLM class flavin-dependent oxidoreductase [Pedobacter cryoconitis]MBB6499677.1 luciferase family oxidoreductase group 1 [Pedobacter cryoconitis]